MSGVDELYFILVIFYELYDFVVDTGVIPS